MDRTVRTSVILIVLGGFFALGSLFIQGMFVKKLPKEKREALIKHAPQPADPLAPKPKPREPTAPPIAPSAAICRDKLKSCFEGKDVDVRTINLGDCYAMCVGVDLPDCPKKTCGDRCEGANGLRETCP